MKAVGERVALSLGAACSAGSGEASHVLRGLGLGDEDAHATLRLCVGRTTTRADVDAALEHLGAGLASVARTTPAPPPPPPARVPDDGFRVDPIGEVRNGLHEPRYIEWRRTVSTIVLAPEWAPALEGLAHYSHVVVVCWLHHTTTCKLTHVPQANVRDVPEVGIFACRCPYRPNPIAITTVRLLAVDGLTLEVEGLDAVHGTPVIDLKPYTPQVDAASGEVRVPAWVDKLVY